MPVRKTHPILAKIEEVRASECEGRRGCRGITGPLKSAYYPDFQPRFEKSARARRTTAKGAGRVGSSAAGMRRGTHVDNQIRQLVRGEPIRAMHAFTKHIVRFMQRFDWTPVDVQTPVWNSRKKLRTEVDLLCVDARGVPVLCEIKCGFEVRARRLSLRSD